MAWEPRDSLPHDGGGGRGELLATSGDVLRLWEMGEGGYGGEGGGFVGRGWSNGQGGGYSLNPRAVLTNVSDPLQGPYFRYGLRLVKEIKLIIRANYLLRVYRQSLH